MATSQSPLFAVDCQPLSLRTREVASYVLSVGGHEAKIRMAAKYHCNVCEQEESKCQCDRYCCLCQGLYNVRLCQDGQYYCLDCREACELAAES